MNDIRQDNLLFKIFPIFTHPYILIMRLDRPIGFILLFYPICFSIVAFSDLNLKIVTLLIIFFIGSIVMRSAGCIINDLLDRDIDNKVHRTQTRPLVSNALSIKNSIICLIALLSIGLFVLLQLNLPSIILALVIVPLGISISIGQKVFLSSPICSCFYL
jgi:4-hydroxybenzoate polyprenyltransferase